MKATERFEIEMEDLFTQWENHDKYNSNKIYHYTSFSNLEKILSSRILWSTVSVHLNDTEELRYFLDHFFKLVNEKIKQCRDVQKIFWQNILNRQDKIRHDWYAFIISFCEKLDYLPAWRFYTKNGTGFGIGFNSNLINPSSETTHKVKRYQVKVSYCEKQMTTKLNKVFNCVARFVNSDNVDELSISLISYIVTMMACFKKSEFKFEKERRLVAIDYKRNGSFVRYNEFCDKFESHYNEDEEMINNYIDRDRIITTKEYLFDYKFEQSMIEEILIGPNLNFDKTQKYVQETLSKYGYNTERACIIKSQSASR